MGHCCIQQYYSASNLGNMNPMKIVLLVATLIGLSVATDYCNKDLCSYGTHVACGHNGQFDKTCPSDAALVNIDQTLQNRIVAAFNEKRNFIAGGGDPQHYPACRMATMEWDDELAKLAELNVKQCRMNHDDCHNTLSFPVSGQNLAWMTYFDTPNIQRFIDGSIQMWYNELKDSSMKYIRSYQRHEQNAVIGHFTAMVADRNYRLGCAAATYTESGKDYSSFLFACNFAFTNVLKQPIYTDCAKPAMDCQTGVNPKYPNLCSTSEKYKVTFF
ncbi:antigen 5 like allergen Cul n 1-like [Musca vetustissima]|uniref:antigen 5 like allergen Cul n 1-like n=1 Tax=Musca vetustissima TaxID=27455 RepID=UPI002AB6C8E3|nr:antigen 5 like allergen Cul n 1-like [Musca vetustissima]